MLVKRFPSSIPARKGRLAGVVAAGLALPLIPILGPVAAPAAAGGAGSTCTLTGLTVGTLAGMQLTAQDSVSGIKKIISPLRLNATPRFNRSHLAPCLRLPRISPRWRTARDHPGR